jgi:hypothetical protein
MVASQEEFGANPEETEVVAEHQKSVTKRQ